jgi:hypothetical protein
MIPRLAVWVMLILAAVAFVSLSVLTFARYLAADLLRFSILRSSEHAEPVALGT